MNIGQISLSIDKLLNVNKWSPKEHDFYQMLVHKVKEYQPVDAVDALGAGAAQIPQETQDQASIDDIKELTDNITNQAWFKGSSNQGSIITLLSSLKIVKCVEQGEPDTSSYTFFLWLEFCNNISLHITMTGRSPRCSLRIYFSRSGDSKAHIVAYFHNSKKGHTLPEYNKLCKILPQLTRSEIVCLAGELLLYYDVHHIMRLIPIGKRYPITLPDLLSRVQELM